MARYLVYRKKGKLSPFDLNDSCPNFKPNRTFNLKGFEITAMDGEDKITVLIPKDFGCLGSLIEEVMHERKAGRTNKSRGK